MWVDKDSHTQHIDPWLPPTTPGNLEAAGANIDEAETY